ncbi:MAG TPA: ClbS/DfsB family four-helix bundle protein [Candidatus Binatia bacterium]|nr:ClbS/DfsB family four-helix bundle protein [Candidatus Binatia bacterium]
MSDKARLLQEADEAFGDLRQAIDELDDARLTRVWLGTWSIREILIHAAGWHREMIPALARVARGEAAYPAGTYDDFDAWNARFVEDRRGVKVADVIAQLEASHRDFVRAAGAVPDQHFAVAKDVLDGAGTGHYREHAGQIRAWRRTESA